MPKYRHYGEKATDLCHSILKRIQGKYPKNQLLRKKKFKKIRKYLFFLQDLPI